jgi:cytochrome b561
MACPSAPVYPDGSFTYHELMAPTARYDSLTIALHWVVAILIVCQWVSGQTIDWFGKGAPRVDARSVHLVIGSLLIAVMAVRILWRVGPGRRLPPADVGLRDLLARGMHYLLYLIVAAVLIGGVATELLRGDNFFGLLLLPKPGDLAGPARHALAEQIGDLHGLGANAILVLAGLHAAAGLFHHYVLKDTVLGRMLAR